MDLYPKFLVGSLIFNVVDLLMLGLLWGGLLRGLKSDIITQAFHLSGIVCATFITIHYYQSLAVIFKEFVPFKNEFLFPGTFHDFLAFSLIAIFVYLIFVFIRDGWAIIININVHPVVNKWSSTLVSLIKMYFICGLIFMALVVTGEGPLGITARQSLSSQFFSQLSGRVYENIEQAIPSALTTDEKSH